MNRQIGLKMKEIVISHARETFGTEGICVYAANLSQGFEPGKCPQQYPAPVKYIDQTTTPTDRTPQPPWWKGSVAQGRSLRVQSLKWKHELHDRASLPQVGGYSWRDIGTQQFYYAYDFISHASKFASLHKELSQDTLSTLLLPKETLTDLDFERHRYFDQALRLHTDCVRFIALKNQDKSLESLRLLEEFASLAYDVALLREVLALQALTCCLYGQWESARGYYQKLVDLGGEARLVEDRKIGYKGMARCYQEGKNYKVAIRCYKKLLECAWDSNDYESEVAAFEGLAQQYYYLGDLKRAGFYLDRMQRGKVERKDSKVREMYLSQLNHKRSLKEKNQVSFAQLNSFNSLYESLTASPGKLGNLSLSTLTTITKKLKSRAKQASSKLQSDFKPKTLPNQHIYIYRQTLGTE